MGRFDAFLEKVDHIASVIVGAVKENRNVIIVAHLDADGLSSAAIIAKAIMRKKGRFLLRIVGDLSRHSLGRLREGDYDLHIFCDIGGGISSQIAEHLGSRWLVIDHHWIPPEERRMENVLNAWQFEYDGSREISAAGTAYLVAKQMDEANIDLSWLSIVGAAGDRQDQGERRSFIGLNQKIVEDAIRMRALSVTTDLVLYGRETRPVHEAIAATTTPYIPGLSGNRDACLAALTSAGLRLQENGRWRTIAELTETEKRKVVEAIIPHLVSAARGTAPVDELIGEVYTLDREDEYSPLRDVREFATVLNACGRMKKPGLGIAICLEDRGQALQEAERVLADYRQVLNRYVQTVLTEIGRLVEKPSLAMIIGDGLVDEDMLGSLASVISNVARFSGRVVLVRTTTTEGDVKFSARKAVGCDPEIDLGLVMRECAAEVGASGGGHDAAAGARIPSHQLQEFARLVDQRLAPGK